MKVHFVCGYYSDLAHRKKRRPEDYWDAYFYVWGVKVGTFKRKFFMHTAEKKIEITEKNFHLARKAFGGFISKRVEERWGAAHLVPIPSKDGVIGTPNFRTSLMLAEALSQTDLRQKQLDALRWSEKLEKAHQGGSRRRDFLKEHLDVVATVKDREIVLVDDLLSTGASLLAARDLLEEKGASVLGAVTCGRTIYDFDTKPFGRQSIDLMEELADFGK